MAFVTGSAKLVRDRKRSIDRCSCSHQESIFRDVERTAKSKGLRFVDRSLGPVITIDAFAGEKRVGYASGYIVPGMKRLHVESLRTAKEEASRGALLEPTVGKLLVLSLLVRAAGSGAKEVFALAIDDGDEQHRRLVQYVKRMGGIPVRRVGSSLKDVRDRLVWGGQGTLMRASLQDLFTKWAPLLRRRT
mmetsp:Transcript_1076/g.3355  ORF Transcript_1076/g.3355 Transcript_1076/m.3355 type:complete len:190 (-) Transcript_1076:2427-2996(-)